MLPVGQSCADGHGTVAATRKDPYHRSIDAEFISKCMFSIMTYASEPSSERLTAVRYATMEQFGLDPHPRCTRDTFRVYEASTTSKQIC